MKDIYNALFRRPLSVWPAGLLLATLNILLFAYEKPWTASDGLRNWGDWWFAAAGVPPSARLLPPWLYSGSVLNLGLLAGASAAALLSRQFAVQIAPPGELAKGFLGGLLMGVGAVVAMGCNIGGFYSALSALSLSGLAMMAGLTVGAFIGLRYLLWEAEHLPGWSSGPTRTLLAAPARGPSRQPWMGGLALVAVAVAVAVYGRNDLAQRGGLLLFGVLLGVILQRSRFCLVRAFREPFLTGDSEMTRAAVLSLLVSLFGFAVLKATDLRSTSAFVFPAFWQGGLAGGTVFGVGMVLAGGCGAGSLWRAAEGHVKLWCAVFGFALASSLARRSAEEHQWLRSLGTGVFLPDVTGWPSALAIIAAVLVAWYLAAAWNEKTRKFAAA
ncbi:MAG: YeeE/YedE family protein [Deltaproteobacteria bacterium]|nr:YeeE/YedE family protein [Deltaproteobacteria bacterium]